MSISSELCKRVLTFVAPCDIKAEAAGRFEVKEVRIYR